MVAATVDWAAAVENEVDPPSEKRRRSAREHLWSAAKCAGGAIGRATYLLTEPCFKSAQHSTDGVLRGGPVGADEINLIQQVERGDCCWKIDACAAPCGAPGNLAHRRRSLVVESDFRRPEDN